MLTAPRNERKTTTSAGLFIAPMECKPVEQLPGGADWQYEPKLDGYRAIVVRQAGQTFLFSRRGQMFNRRFPRLTRVLEQLPGRAFTLDGELLAFDEAGRPSFALVQEPDEARDPLHFFAFDLLRHNRTILLNHPLEDRRALLEQMARTWPEEVRLCPVLPGRAAALLERIEALGLEGLVAKRKDSPYKPGERSGLWVKHKVQQSDEFLIGGYIPGTQGFDEILVGKPEGKELRFVESVANGFVPRTKQQVTALLRGKEITTCPFYNLPEKGVRKMNEDKMERVRWVKPKVVVEIAFNNVTDSGHLRHVKFLRLRLDKME